MQFIIGFTLATEVLIVAQPIWLYVMHYRIRLKSSSYFKSVVLKG